VRIEDSKNEDALYIQLRDVPVAESRDIAEGVTLRLDAGGRIVGLEVRVGQHSRLPAFVIPHSAIVRCHYDGAGKRFRERDCSGRVKTTTAWRAGVTGRILHWHRRNGRVPSEERPGPRTW